MPYFLAIDQGGHASRALVFDESGQAVASAEVAVETDYPQSDWVEHDAERLLASVQQALVQVAAQLDVSQIRAAGLATQRSSVVCWHRISGAALSPVLSWQDRRQHRWLEAFKDYETLIHQKTGLRLSPHYGASKLRWCLDHLPSLQGPEVELCLGPLASFLLHRLLLQHPNKVDPAHASRTLLWNLATRDWDSQLSSLFGVPQAYLPQSVASQHAFGDLLLGGQRVPLSVCTGDQSAAFFAWGKPLPQQVCINLGTGAFIQRACDVSELQADLLCSVAYWAADFACYTLEGTVNGAARALQWFADLHGIADWAGQLELCLQQVTQPPLFLNGIAGLGSPDWRADFASRFVAPPANSAAGLVAIVESIVFLLQRNLERMGHCSCLRLSGGLANSDGLCQRLANLSGLPVMRAKQTEATARGLAWLLAGRPDDWQLETVSFEPIADPELSARYQRWTLLLECDLSAA